MTDSLAKHSHNTNSYAPILSRYRSKWQKRRIFLVDPKIQYKLMKQVAILGLFVSVLVLCNLYVIQNLAEIYEDDLAINSYSMRDNVLVFAYGILALAVNTGVCLLMVLFFSHRIAGPSIKIVRSLAEIAQGDLSVHIRLRKSDHLKEIATGVNKLVGGWNASMSEIQQTVRLLREQSDAAGQGEAFDDQLKALEKLIDRYQTKA